MGDRRRSRNGSLVAQVIGEHLKGPDVVAHQSPISIQTSYQCAYDIQTLKFELVINVVVELERHILLFVNCHLVVASFLQYELLCVPSDHQTARRIFHNESMKIVSPRYFFADVV